jgi:hypothetical protein
MSMSISKSRADSGAGAGMSSSDRRQQEASAVRGARAARLSWVALAVICMVYGPIAINYMWQFFDSSIPALWDHVYATIVGKTQALGPGSVAERQHAAYANSQVAMLLHTMAGGTAIMLGVTQFSTRLRQRRPAVHRGLGRMYLIVVLIGMVAAGVYLTRTGPQRTYDGPVFYIQLWTLLLGTVISAVLALVAIRRREIAIHQGLMALNFGLLLTAPILRVDWLIMGVIAPHATQATINLAAAASATSIAVGGAILASRRFDTRKRAGTNTRAFLSPLAERAIWIAAAAATVLVAARYVITNGALDSTLSALVISAAIWLLLCNMLERSSRRQANLNAAHDWHLHRLAITGSVIALAIVWQLFSLLLPDHQAFGAAALTAPGATMTLGLLTVLWNRRRQSADTARIRTTRTRAPNTTARPGNHPTLAPPLPVAP